MGEHWKKVSEIVQTLVGNAIILSVWIGVLKLIQLELGSDDLSIGPVPVSS
jgi:hypothetical protein